MLDRLSQLHATMLAIFWDPSGDAFVIPFFNHPVRWYSILFALGFFGAYLVVARGLWLDYITNTPFFKVDQILNWQGFVKAIQNSKEPELSSLKNTLNEYDTLNAFLPAHKDQIIQSVNKWLGSKPDIQNQKTIFPHLLLSSQASRRLYIEKACKDTVLSAKHIVLQFVDRFAWYIFFGLIIGARLGEVLFYDFDFYKERPLQVFMTWKGGLASHGAGIGILLAVVLFWKYNKAKLPTLSWKRLLDILCVGASFSAGCIRLGNFINQEILGKPTDLPWGVIFGTPQDIAVIMPCHPVQLYEALFYFGVFAVLCLQYYMSKKEIPLLRTSGLFFILVFGFRFIIEFLKLPQEAATPGSIVMGQILSIPFIVLGIFFLYYPSKK